MKKTNTLLLSKDLSNILNFVNVLKYSFNELSIIYDELSLYELMGKSVPDLIVIDSTSIENTAACVRLIRNKVNLNACPVVVITKDVISEEGVAVLREGASDYISLNVCDEELYLRIRFHLNCITQSNKTDQVIIDKFAAIYPIEDRDVLLFSERYINNYMDDIKNAADLSLAIGISERKVKEVFKLHLNMSTAEYIRNKKIKRAKELLSTTCMTMSDIALELGYSSAANFSTSFKQVEGISPSKYKFKNRKINYN